MQICSLSGLNVMLLLGLCIQMQLDIPFPDERTQIFWRESLTPPSRQQNFSQVRFVKTQRNPKSNPNPKKTLKTEKSIMIAVERTRDLCNATAEPLWHLTSF